MKAIKTSGLTKFYGKNPGIQDLNLEVEEGEFYGFIGPNGAGKSTTIRTLLGLIRKSRGTASILGMDIVKDQKEILSQIGYLPAEAVFYSGMRVKELLRLSADLHKKDCRQAGRLLCERLQLDTSRKIEELSFGNRKKAAIVCALQHENQKGMTVFLSSHILSEIQRYCSRAAIIRKGQIIASGSVEELSRTSAKRITVHGKFTPESLDGIRDLQSTEEESSFLYSGDINLLLQVLSSHPIKDLNISEPDLEEIFLHYYREGGNIQ